MTTQQNNAGLSEFLDFMSRKGLNTTSQRRIIAEAFFELPGHHSLEEFYQHVIKRDSGIGQTTVYRTLKLLCDAGLAMEIHFSDGITRYEIAKPDSHHDHLVCLDCGKIVEICDPRIENSSVKWPKNTASSCAVMCITCMASARIAETRPPRTTKAHALRFSDFFGLPLGSPFLFRSERVYAFRTRQIIFMARLNEVDIHFLQGQTTRTSSLRRKELWRKQEVKTWIFN